jgi:hypothetical protein
MQDAISEYREFELKRGYTSPLYVLVWFMMFIVLVLINPWLMLLAAIPVIFKAGRYRITTRYLYWKTIFGQERAVKIQSIIGEKTRIWSLMNTVKFTGEISLRMWCVMGLPRLCGYIQILRREEFAGRLEDASLYACNPLQDSKVFLCKGYCVEKLSMYRGVVLLTDESAAFIADEPKLSLGEAAAATVFAMAKIHYGKFRIKYPWYDVFGIILKKPMSTEDIEFLMESALALSSGYMYYRNESPPVLKKTSFVRTIWRLRYKVYEAVVSAAIRENDRRKVEGLLRLWNQN